MASPGIGPWHLAIWLVLAYAGWSILSLSQLALASNVSPDYNERSRIYGWWQVAFFIGMIGAMLLPKLVQMQGFTRSEEHTSELQSLMRISYAVFCLKKKN